MLSQNTSSDRTMIVARSVLNHMKLALHTSPWWLTKKLFDLDLRETSQLVVGLAVSVSRSLVPPVESDPPLSIYMGI